MNGEAINHRGRLHRSAGVRLSALLRRAGSVFVAAALVGLAVSIVDGRPARAQDTAATSEEYGRVLHRKVTLFKSLTIPIPSTFEKALIGAPDIADVLPLTGRSVYIQGKKVGATNISIFDPNQRLIEVIDLEVTPDTNSMSSKIRSSTGGNNIKVSSAGGEVVLSGEASDAVSASRAIAVAKGLSPDAPIVDAMKVSPSQQVMLKVRILEVDRAAGRDLGVNLFGGKGRNTISTGLGQFTNNTIGPTGVAGVGVSQTFAGAAAAASPPFGLLFSNLVNAGGFKIDSLLSALETKGLVRSLAEPDLIALSGEEASFLAGGEIPVPTVQPGSNGGTPTVSIQYKPFGVQLTFVPTVLGNGLIDLRLAPSVSEIDTANSVLVNGTTIPQLTKREARTTVELRDGQSFAIAGLLQASHTEDISQVPYLGTIPILGALFRSTNYQKHETDLVIIVTPHLVRPAGPHDHLATPFDQNLAANDVDLFLMGDLERKKKYNEYVTSGGELKGPYGDIITAEALPVHKRWRK